SGRLPRGATGAVFGGPCGCGDVGGATVTSVSGANGAAGSGCDAPPGGMTADASGRLPRGATGAVCGGVSGPGRTLAANSCAARAPSSAAPTGQSLLAATHPSSPGL